MDRAKFKTQGLAFGRGLQTAFKTVVMYSAEHPAADRFLQQAYGALTGLLAQTPQFTFGFSNHRLLLNDLLTDEPILAQLDADFQRRGVAGITFLAGITLADLKQVLTVVGGKPKDIDAAGGMARYVAAHPLQRARVVVSKVQDGEDTVVEADTESFLKGELPTGQGMGGEGLSTLLQFAGAELAHPLDAPLKGHEVLDVAGKAVEAALLGQVADPQAVAEAVTQLVEQIQPATVLSALPAGKQAALQGQGAAEVAMDVMEDVTAGMVATRIATAPEGAMAAVAESEAVRIMTIGLGMTRMADRLLQKLSRMLQEANVPPEVFERIRQGILWHGLSPEQKQERLLATTSFDERAFQRLLEHVKECMAAKRIPEATQVAAHYFGFLDASLVGRQVELVRSRELLAAVVDPATFPLLTDVANRLGTRLLDEPGLAPECHAAGVGTLAGLARLAITQGDLALPHRVGMVLERCVDSDPVRHEGCCIAALAELVPPEVAARLVDLHLEKRGDSGQAKATVDLLRWLGVPGAEEAFRRLTEEQASSERMLLLGLLAQLRPSGIAVARTRLQDGRWFVVRNACVVLGDLEDSEIVRDVRGALRHGDARVQQAAVTALVKSEATEVATALAEALPALEARVAETALEELSFRKDPATIDGLEKFLHLGKGSKPAALEKAVHALAAIASERAARVLGVVMGDAGQVPFVRRAAAEALIRCPQPVAKRLLAAYARVAPVDPIASLIQRSLQRTPQP